MALVKSKFRDDWLEDRRKRFDDWAIREPIWHDRFLNDWPDWPQDWPHPRDVVDRVRYFFSKNINTTLSKKTCLPQKLASLFEQCLKSVRIVSKQELHH